MQDERQATCIILKQESRKKDMKENIVKVTFALATAGCLMATSVLAADEQTGQSGQTGQAGQQGGASMQQPNQAGSIAQAWTAAASSPTEFIQRAYQNNLTEIQLGELAQQKGESQQVKDFGKQLAEGHQALNTKLTQLAAQKNITLESKPDSRHQMVIDRLQQFSGTDFDKRFVNEQVMAHRRDVAFYDLAASKNTDPEVKSFAESSLPSLREHLQMAQAQATTINEAAGAEQKGGKTQESDQQQQQQQQPQQQPQSQPQQQ